MVYGRGRGALGDQRPISTTEGEVPWVTPHRGLGVVRRCRGGGHYSLTYILPR